MTCLSASIQIDFCSNLAPEMKMNQTEWSEHVTWWFSHFPWLSSRCDLCFPFKAGCYSTHSTLLFCTLRLCVWVHLAGDPLKGIPVSPVQQTPLWTKVQLCWCREKKPFKTYKKDKNKETAGKNKSARSRYTWNKDINHPAIHFTTAENKNKTEPPWCLWSLTQDTACKS